MTTTPFYQTINQFSEQTVQLCYHCHKCTSGCPVAAEMQYGPDRILRMVQLGHKDALLKSRDIWICASCETCGTRCPNEIDIARVMDALRQMAHLENTKVGEPDALKFHRLFLNLTRYFGRMHEVSLMGILTLWTRKMLTDVNTIIKLLLKGKAPLLPHPVKARREIQHIFEHTQQKSAVKKTDETN